MTQELQIRPLRLLGQIAEYRVIKMSVRQPARYVIRGLTVIAMSISAVSAEAADLTLNVLTYNVAGLPPLVQSLKDEPELDPLVHIPQIPPHLLSTEYDVVALQEAFVHADDSGEPYDDIDSTGVGTYFYDTLTANTASPQFSQVQAADAVMGESAVASGLGRLSNSMYTGYLRNKWDRLEGFDAESDKGYSFARHHFTGVGEIDIYNWHSNAGGNSNPDGQAARKENVEELIKAINTNSPGRAVIIMGDSNNLYPRTYDTIRRLLGLEEAPAEIPETEDLDVPFKDVWIEVARNGSVPVQDDNRLKICDGPNLQAGSDCEHKDKIFYRSSETLQIQPTEYFVEMGFVNAGTTTQLSDHWPVGASFAVTAPEFPINVGHSGAWFNEDTAGQGQLIDVVPETQYMFLAWYTFTAAASNTPDQQHWYTAQGNYSGNTAELILYETLGGQFDNPKETSTNPVGTVTLSFTDCEHGRMVYNIDTDGRHGTVPLERAVPGSHDVCEKLHDKADNTTQAVDINAGMDGSWANKDTLGQGFLIDAHPNPDGDNFIFVGWFTYGDDTASGLRWLTAQGDFEGSTAEIDIYETIGGRFDDPQTVETNKVGTMAIDFTDCSNANLSYSLTDDGLAGDMAISRLIPGGQALCEELAGVE